MDLHHKQEVTVGLLVIVSAALFAVGLSWLSGKTLFGSSGMVTVPVRFSDVLGLRAGDPVMTSGVRVGTVESVVLQDVGEVMVNLLIKEESRPHTDARAAVSSLDLLGAKYISYSPGKSAQMQPEDQAITGAREAALTEGAAGLTKQAGEVMLAMQNLLTQQMADDIHNTMIAATRAMDVVTRLGGGPQINEALAAVSSLKTVSTHLDSILGNPSIKKSIDQLDELTTSVNEMADGLSTTTRSLGAVLKKIDEGKGTLGKAANDTALYHNLNETMLKMQQLLDDIRRNPGRYINVKVF